MNVWQCKVCGKRITEPHYEIAPKCCGEKPMMVIGQYCDVVPPPPTGPGKEREG